MSFRIDTPLTLDGKMRSYVKNSLGQTVLDQRADKDTSNPDYWIDRAMDALDNTAMPPEEVDKIREQVYDILNRV